MENRIQIFQRWLPDEKTIVIEQGNYYDGSIIFFCWDKMEFVGGRYTVAIFKIKPKTI
jgi:cephalosporin hydroxylase